MHNFKLVMLDKLHEKSGEISKNKDAAGS